VGESIQEVYIRTFERNVRHLAQQSVTRLEPYVMSKSVQSEAHNWELINSNDADLKSNRDPWPGNNRSRLTPDDDTQWERRQSTPNVYNIGDVTEHSDIAQMLVDPNSNYAKAHAMAMRRVKDDVIIEAAVGPSKDGSGVAIPFDANQAIGATGSPVPFTFDLITEVSEKFMLNDIDPDDSKVFVISPAQARKLLQLTEATSGDYNAVRPLTSKGYIESWMGYTWVVSTRLQAPAAGERYVFAMTRKAIGMQVNKDIWTRVAEDPSISFAYRIYSEMHLGAIRVEDKHLVRCAVSEA